MMQKSNEKFSFTSRFGFNLEHLTKEKLLYMIFYYILRRKLNY